MSTQDAVKKAGLKATLPRMLILEVLAKTIDSEVHLSAEDIYKDLLTSGDDVGLATVYRVLSQFESAGIVTRHNFEEGHSVYEMTQDHHHDHMVCVDTGKTIEFHDPEIEKRQVYAFYIYQIWICDFLPFFLQSKFYISCNNVTFIHIDYNWIIWSEIE